MARARYRLGCNRLVKRFLEEQRPTIDGHTILAAYRKKGERAG